MTTVSKEERARNTALRQAVYAASADADLHADNEAFNFEMARNGIRLPSKDLNDLTVPELLDLRNSLKAVAPKIQGEAALRALAYTMSRVCTTLEALADEGAPTMNAMAEAHFGRTSVAGAHAGRSGRHDGPRFVDQATGRTMSAIDKHDSRADIAGKLGVSSQDPGYGIADWIRAIANVGGGNKESMSRVRATLTEGTNSQGGYLVPSELLPQFLQALVPASTLLNAGVPILNLPDGAASFTIGSVATVPTAAWRSESAAVASSDPAFGVVTLTPRSLAFTFDVSRELLADASNLDAILLQIISQAMAMAIDAAGLRGTGTPPVPTGILNNASVNAITNGVNGATFSSIKWANMTAAIQAILTANAPVPTDCIMAPRSLVGIANMVDTLGQPLRRPDILQNVNFAATSQIPINLTVGTSSDCTELYIGNFARSMTFGFRETLSVLRSIELKMATGLVSFVAHSRMDVGVLYPTALGKITGVRAG